MQLSIVLSARKVRPLVSRLQVLRIVFGALMAVVACASAFAQTASVSGQVMDPRGAVIRGAKVKITNEKTNAVQSAITNNAGIYSIPFVVPGRYTLIVEAAGFKAFKETNIPIATAQSLEIDAKLEIGAVGQSVTVNGYGASLNVLNATVSTTVDQQFVANTPLNGRSLQDLISLTPGVVTQNPNNGYEGDFSVNGQRTESNNYLVDGVSANIGGSLPGTPGPMAGGNLGAHTALGTTQSILSLDALQEFTVNSSSYSAEYGRDPGGQFIFTSRSGGNNYHGSLFEYLRNNYFDANNWFNDYYNKPEPALRQNDFGGTFSGAVRIPGLYRGKDKTFFFVSYEGMRLMLPIAASAQYVPSTASRSAASSYLSGMVNAFPLPTDNKTLYVACSTTNSTTATPCPSGDANGTLVDSGLQNFNMPASVPSHIDSTSARIDHRFSDRESVFFRYGYTPSYGESRSESSVTQTRADTRTFTGSVTSQLKYAFVNNFTLNYSSSSWMTVGSIDSFGGAKPDNMAADMGAGEYPYALPTFFDYRAGVGYASLGTSNRGTKLGQWNVVDSLNRTFGHHNMKFGVDYRRLDVPLYPYNPQLTAYYYNTSQIDNNSAYMLIIGAHLASELAFNDFSFYVQDEWRAASRLTLSLGLRWDVDPAPETISGPALLTLQGSLSNPSTLSVAPAGSHLFPTTYHNFAPRIGAAYVLRSEPNWETVVRAGGGVFFDTINEGTTWGAGGLGTYTQSRLYNVSFPLASSTITSVTPSASATSSSIIYDISPHLQLPYTIQWNLAVQQALGKSQTFTTTYLGSVGRRLLGMQSYSLSALNSNYGSVYYTPGGMTSDYHALQLQYQRTLHHGLQALASYTWSHSIDVGSSVVSNLMSRGNSDFDVRQNFQAAVSWDAPKFTHGGALGRQALSNWGVDLRMMARTGFPLNIVGTWLTSSTSGMTYYGPVKFVTGQPIYLHGSQYPGGMAINQAAFCDPNSSASVGCTTMQTAGATIGGVVPRNYVRGFGENQINLAFRRDFPVRENLKMQFRAESFNVLNHPIFGSQDQTLSDSNFGKATQTLNTSGNAMLSQQYMQGGPRSMQFALKLMF